MTDHTPPAPGNQCPIVPQSSWLDECWAEAGQRPTVPICPTVPFGTEWDGGTDWDNSSVSHSSPATIGVPALWDNGTPEPGSGDETGKRTGDWLADMLDGLADLLHLEGRIVTLPDGRRAWVHPRFTILEAA